MQAKTSRNAIAVAKEDTCEQNARIKRRRAAIAVARATWKRCARRRVEAPTILRRSGKEAEKEKINEKNKDMAKATQYKRRTKRKLDAHLWADQSAGLKANS